MREPDPTSAGARPATASAWSQAGVVLIGILAVLVASWPLIKVVRDAPEHVDEIPWIVSSLHYTHLVLRGDFTSSAWEGTDLSLYGSLNPHVGHLWLGLGLRLHPATRDLAFTPAQARQLTREPAPLRDLISAPTLQAARQVHAASGVLCLALVFAIANGLTGPRWAAIPVVALGWSPAFSDVLGRVFTDGPALLGLLAIVVCLIRFVGAQTARGRLTWSAAAGAAAGFAFNVKMTNLLLGVLLITIVVAIAGRYRHEPLRCALQAIGLGAAGALVTAVALNPYFWPTAAAPASGGTWRVFLPARIADEQPPRDFSPVSGHAPVWLRLAESHLRWRRQIAAQTAWYHETFKTTRPTRATVLRRVTHTYNHGWPGALAVLVAGGLYLQHRWRRAAQRFEALDVLAVAAIVQVGWIVLMLPTDWDRYYLPAVAHVQLFTTIALVWGLTRQRPPIAAA